MVLTTLSVHPDKVLKYITMRVFVKLCYTCHWEHWWVEGSSLSFSQENWLPPLMTWVGVAVLSLWVAEGLLPAPRQQAPKRYQFETDYLVSLWYEQTWFLLSCYSFTGIIWRLVRCKAKLFVCVGACQQHTKNNIRRNMESEKNNQRKHYSYIIIIKDSIKKSQKRH